MARPAFVARARHEGGPPPDQKQPERMTIPAETITQTPVSAPRRARLIALAVAAILAIVLGAMLLLQDQSRDAVTRRDREAQMRLTAGALTSAFDQAGKFALSLAEMTARRPDIAAALDAGDKKKLQALSQNTYDYLARQAGVQIYGYHSREIRYLLRMHRPETSGDDISGFRPMVVAANRLQRPQSGLEIGIAGIGIRGIALLNHADGNAAPVFAGTMEVGLDTRPILDLVKASTNADLAILIAPSMTGVALDPKLPVFGDLALAVSTDDALLTAFLKSGLLKATRGVEIREAVVEGRNHAFITQPLIDFSGKLVGIAVAIREVSVADSRRIGTELLVTALVGLILAHIAFAVLTRMALAKADPSGTETAP